MFIRLLGNRLAQYGSLFLYMHFMSQSKKPQPVVVDIYLEPHNSGTF